MPFPTPARLAVLAAFVPSVLAARPAVSQQLPATIDTITTAVGAPTTEAARVGVGRSRTKKHDRLPFVFYGALGGAVATAAVFHVDPDTGGYSDGWTTDTDFPDKAVHALAAWAITSIGVDLGVRPRYSAVAVCATGTAFEFAQGYVSVYDIAADCAGAAGAAAWQTWRAKRRARQRPH